MAEDPKVSQVLVAGDVTIDWFSHPQEHLAEAEQGGADEAENWRRYPGTRWWVLPGGALMLKRFIEQAVEPGVQVMT